MTRTTPLLDDTQYPHRWSEYIGQQRAKESLRVAAKSARMRKRPLDHILIANPRPGIGKTALAVLVASEMKVNVRVVTGSLDDQKARWLFAEMQDRDILIFEEFHRMFEGSKRSWQWLLNFMQDGAIMGPMGLEGTPLVTLIATTTEGPSIPKTAASRFGPTPMLLPYTDAEAARIALKMADSVLDGLPPLHRPEALTLARAANNNPRAIKQMLTVLRDLTITSTLPTTERHYNIPALLDWEGITADGLDQVAQRYMITLATELGGFAGERALADRMQLAGGIADVERLLMERGLVSKTRGGRMLTKAGIIRTKVLIGSDQSAA